MSKPETINLGNIEEPVLIFGGPYSNLHSTKALKAWADENGFAADRIICTGDIVAYCAHPKETSELIRDWGVHCIEGNVEQSLAEAADDCGCGFEEGTTCDILSNGWYNYAQANVDNDLRQWFSTMPAYLTFEFYGKAVQVVHGAPSNVSRFMYLSQPDTDFKSEFALTKADVIIAGHSGVPFTKQVGDKLWHNSGALGVPANDGTSKVWFSVLGVDADGTPKFTHQALDYDFAAAKQSMQDVGLTQGYHQALSDGLWPSMDVLPEIEKTKVGKAIDL